MRRWPAALAAVAVLVGCGSPKDDSEWRPARGEREYLEEWAGRIARSLVPPRDPGDLDSLGMMRLMARCDSVPQRYVYLYQRVADSIQAMTPPEPGCVQQPSVADTVSEDEPKEASPSGSGR
ncbi:MAG: hypothetical protein R6U36_03785 [Candidatus Fermentibacteraceae bacterium]